MSDFWPLSVDPKPDELLTSWLLRNAHRHYQKVHTFYAGYLHKYGIANYRIWTVDLDRYVKNEFVSLLSDRTGLSVEVISNTTLKFYEGKLFESIVKNGNTKWLLPQGHYSARLKRNNILYCPGCFSNDSVPYFRKPWKLSISFLCVNCKLLLREACWSCGTNVNYIRTELGEKNQYNFNRISCCHVCMSDLGDAKSIEASEEELKLQSELYRYVEQGYAKQLGYSHLYFDALYQVCTILISSNKSAFNLQYYVANECDIRFKIALDFGQNNFDCLDVRSRLDILKMATWLLDDWPDRFLHAMRKTKSGTSIQFLNRLQKEDLPFWYTSVRYSPGFAKRKI